MPNVGECNTLNQREDDIFNLADRYRELMNALPKYIITEHSALDSSKMMLVVDRVLNCTKYYYDCNDDLMFIDGVVGQTGFERMAKFFKGGE